MNRWKYMQLVAIIMLMTLIYGVIAPAMVSYNNTLVCFAGVVVAVLIGPLLGYSLLKPFIVRLFNAIK